ncbi:MAG: hypothetical protein IPP48_14465 [Chitinophagaceae bacterium]|nr:hypothetical protein [Chitinophagaceae bacterium]
MLTLAQLLVKHLLSAGETATYTVDWVDWNNEYENFANVTWNVVNGTVLSSDKHTVTIQWKETLTWLNEEGSIEVSEDLGGGGGTLAVNIVNFVLGTSETCSGVLGTPAILKILVPVLTMDQFFSGTTYE